MWEKKANMILQTLQQEALGIIKLIEIFLIFLKDN